MKNTIKIVITLLILIVLIVTTQEALGYGIPVAQCALEDYTNAEIRDYVLKYYTGCNTKVYPAGHIEGDKDLIKHVLENYNTNPESIAADKPKPKYITIYPNKPPQIQPTPDPLLSALIGLIIFVCVIYFNGR